MNGALYRPDPIVKHTAAPVDQTAQPRLIARRIRDGESFVVTDFYSTGADIMAQLESLMPVPPQEAAYAKRKAHALVFREASSRLLAPVISHRLALKDGKPIGFLEDLYPGLSDFCLPFSRVQELYGAWQRYLDGVHLAVIGRRVYPYFGTYAPTRTSHLELFGTWLSQYKGAKSHAIDVGTGCGVLGFMLARFGFSRITSTDSNPNAVESVRRELLRIPESPPIEVQHADLLGEGTELADLIVFNPPWIPGEIDGVLDQALVFQDGLFDRFFNQCVARLAPGGRVVIIFSNIMSLVRPDVDHPILTELESQRFTLVQNST